MATIVIDANIGIALISELAYSDLAEHRLMDWRANNVQIAVPALWWYEVVSTLRKGIVTKEATLAQVNAAMDDLANLGVKTYEPTSPLSRGALVWAERLKQTVAYDAQYLALAEHLSAEFWTADRKLADRAREIKASFVHFLQPMHGKQQIPGNGDKN